MFLHVGMHAYIYRNTHIHTCTKAHAHTHINAVVSRKVLVFQESGEDIRGVSLLGPLY